jgi:thiol-disulfide isomerase/thioredoxin
MEFKRVKDANTAKSEAAAEESLYPDNLAAVTFRWGMEGRGEPALEKIRSELDRLYDSKKGDEDALAFLVPWFERTGQQARADEMRKSELASRPKGKMARGMAQSQAFSTQDPKTRVQLLLKLEADFPPESDERATRLNALANAYVAAGEYDKAAEVMRSMANPSGDAYNSLAWDMIEKDVQVDKAVGYAKTGVDILRRPGKNGKPSYLTDAQWERSNRTSLGMILDTYAFGLFKLNRLEDAAAAYEESYKLTDGKDNDINRRLIECSQKLGRTERVLALVKEMMESGKGGEEAEGYYKTAYIQQHGSEKGLEDALAGLRRVAAKKSRDEILKDRINKPATDFSLKSLDGSTVTLAGLRGKVVVLDFWATWCGPCKYSFPFLQKVYNRYKGNDKVAILTLNTWERVAGKERETLVRKFIEDNKYTFPVLFDENMVEKYGVEGIPTKFIIDRTGKIQFKQIGAEGEEMLTKLPMQIELLLTSARISLPWNRRSSTRRQQPGLRFAGGGGTEMRSSIPVTKGHRRWPFVVQAMPQGRDGGFLNAGTPHRGLRREST